MAFLRYEKIVPFFEDKNVSLVVGGGTRQRKEVVQLGMLDCIPTFDKKKVGNRIQEARLKKGMTGAELGAYIGRSANTVSRIERGEISCDIEKLYIICKCLDVSADYLLFGEEEERHNITNKQKQSIVNLIEAFTNA